MKKDEKRRAGGGAEVGGAEQVKDSQRLLEEQKAVENALGDSIICNRCGATLKTYATVCSAELSDPCPGFMSIERAREDFARKWWERSK